MTLSKNFLVLAGLTLIVTGMLSLHPLAPHSSESASEALANRMSTTRSLN